MASSLPECHRLEIGSLSFLVSLSGETGCRLRLRRIWSSFLLRGVTNADLCCGGLRLNHLSAPAGCTQLMAWHYHHNSLCSTRWRHSHTTQRTPLEEPVSSHRQNTGCCVPVCTRSGSGSAQFFLVMCYNAHPQRSHLSLTLNEQQAPIFLRAHPLLGIASDFSCLSPRTLRGRLARLAQCQCSCAPVFTHQARRL